METKLQVLLSILLLFSFLNGYGQQNYYWSGHKKNNLNIDSTRVIAYAKDPSNLSRLRSKILLMKEVISVTHLSIGVKQPLQIKIEKASYQKFKNDVTGFSELGFIVPYYSIDTHPFYFTNEIVLKPKKNVSVDQIINLADGILSIKEKTRYNTYLLELNDFGDILSIANSIYESGLVEWCHPNFKANLTKAVIPTDPTFAQQYYLNNTGQLGGVANFDINAPEAWEVTLGCNNIRVVVIDDGVEAHEDMGGRVLAGFTPVSGGNGAPDALGAHGQACAGIIAASQNNGLGISGVAPNSLIIPVNMFAGGTTVNDVAAGINWAWDPAAGNADIISNSWGGPAADIIRQAITDARTLGRTRNGVTLGCPVIFASGNNHISNPGEGVAFPAEVDGVIAVGALRNNGTIWNYSSRGPEMDLVAPSGDINLNGDVRTIDRTGANGYEAGDYTTRFGGTSAACPQVAGVVALILSVNPNLTEAAVRTILQQTARDLGTTGFDNTYGFGLVNAQAALNRVQTDLGLAMTGPQFVCTSATYSVNYPSGTFTTWQTSSNLTKPRTALTSITVTKSGGNGLGYIKATRNINGCVTSVFRQVHVGPENANFSITAYPYCANPSEVVDFVAGISNVNYSWTVNGGTLLGGQGTQSIYARMIDPSMVAHCAVTGASAANCYGPQGTSSTYINQCWGFSSLSTSPNPASTSFDVELSEKIEDTEPVEIELRNGYGDLVKSETAHGRNFKVNAANLREGAYILKVKYRDQVLTHRVIIEN